AGLAGEAQRAAVLVHANIARVFGKGVTSDGSPGLVSEFVDGINLHAYLTRRANYPLEPGELWPLATGGAEGLDQAHACGIMHGDVKPSNILIRCADWLPKLVDFGLAHRLEGSLARSAQLVGTAIYLAPEVWALGAAATTQSEARFRLRRADIYSFA